MEEEEERKKEEGGERRGKQNMGEIRMIRTIMRKINQLKSKINKFHTTIYLLNYLIANFSQ